MSNDTPPSAAAPDALATAPAVPATAPADPALVADDDAETTDTNPDLTELEKVRRQAARYRTERNKLREELAQAQAAPTPDPVAEATRRAEAAERRVQLIEAAHEAGIPADVLKDIRAVSEATGDDVAKALQRLAKRLSAPQGVPTPPGAPAQPLTLQDQIREAERTKDTALAMRLKAELMTQLARQG